MSPNLQLYLSASIPSILVILSWIHNNTRLSRLEAGQDNANKCMDDMIHGFHNDMMTFQASILEAVYLIRERVTAIETKRNG
jgi:hypothetical protein